MVCSCPDPNRFLSDLKSYDRDNIPDRLIVDIEPFINMPEFEPDVIDRASKACSGICLWVRAMYKYHHVVKLVEPKKRKLAEAQETLDRTMGELNIAKKRLGDVLDRVAALEDEFKATQVIVFVVDPSLSGCEFLNGTQLRREFLVNEVQSCRLRLERATKLLTALGGEQQRWLESVEKVRLLRGAFHTGAITACCCWAVLRLTGTVGEGLSESHGRYTHRIVFHRVSWPVHA